VFAHGDGIDATACLPNQRVEEAKTTLQWLSGKPHRKTR
jgi:hypothetical protein